MVKKQKQFDAFVKSLIVSKPKKDKSKKQTEKPESAKLAEPQGGDADLL